MAIVERDVVLQSKDADGNQTIDFPITRLANVEDAADVKITPENGDYLALVDSSDKGQMKKVPAEAFAKYTSDSRGMEAHIGDTAKHLPSGGTTGYLLVKSSGNVVEWRPPMSNPNLLDNWYFLDPINQRGATEYAGSRYVIDRWFFAGGDATLLVGNSGVTIPKDKLIGQKFENIIIEKLIGQILTFSVMLSDGTLYSGTAKFQIGTDLSFVENSNIKLFWWENGGGYFSIYAVGTEKTAKAAKLELGSQQTLAHQDESGNWVLNDPPPNKALELLKCQRYYQVNKTSQYIAGSMYSNFAGVFTVPGTEMRADPVIVSFSVPSGLVDFAGTSHKDLSIYYIGTDFSGIKLHVIPSDSCAAGVACLQDFVIELSADL